MRRLPLRAPSLLLWLFLLQPLFGLGSDPEKLYYGFEMNGTLVGYVEMTITPPEEPGEPRRMTSVLFAKMTLLGQDFDLRMDESYALDPESGDVLQHRSETVMGTMTIVTTALVEGDEVRLTSASGGEPKVLEIDDEVILEDSVHLGHILEGIPEEGGSAIFRVLDYNSGEIQNVRYERGADTTFPLEGKEISCAVFQVSEPTTGFSGEAWLDLETGRVMRVTLPNSVVVYRAEPAVVGKIKRAELDDLLLAPVDVAIADFMAIEAMKVRVKLRTMGQEVTAESLNVPGQKFTGTVEENLVEGVFEIEHARYEGEGAPPFPPDLAGDEDLLEALEPEQLIEADDSVLREFARELTTGSTDSWDAARRLSKWVAEQIAYEIPGGSARDTFDARKGECGSHSRLLVAFCRSVGIPARLVSGCMYVPNYGGSFGQHAWTEVHMGEAGWIPVDSTVREIDYVDSGHIRLGTLASFLPEEMEILDYRVPSMEGGSAGHLGRFAGSPWKTGETYVFEYVFDGKPLGTDSFTIVSEEEQDGRTVITIETSLELTGRTVVGSFQLDGDGHPIRYNVKGKAGAVEYTVDCEFTAGQVVEKAVQAGRSFERTVELPEEVFLVDNNNFGGFAMLLAAVPRKVGTNLSFKVFHPTSMQLLPVQIKVAAVETITIGEKEHACTRCEMNLAGTPLTLWLDEGGRILRETEAGGRMVVELQ